MATLVDTTLSGQERRVLERFVGLLLHEGIDPEAVWLYGSRARGEERRPESDVDLLVLVADRKAEKLAVRKLLYQAAEAEDASPPFYSAQVWDREWLADRQRIDSFFWQEVEREKVVVYEKP